MGESYRIGGWAFDVEGNALVDGEVERRLEDRTARTLALLCRRRGEIVSQQAILEEVWNGRAVSPNSVAVVIADLRRQLGDDAREPAHIVTIPKRGYRLNLERPFERPNRRRAIAAGVAALLAAGGAALTAAHLAATETRTLIVETVRNDTGEARYRPLATALDELVTNRATRIDGMRVVRAAGTGAPDTLRLESRLILWNGEPTLSMSATEIGSNTVVWTAMAAGPADALAGNTIRSLDRFRAEARDRRTGKL